MQKVHILLLKNSFRLFMNSFRNFSSNSKKSFETSSSFIFNTGRFLKSVLLFSFWSKTRTIYYINNWVYTTNHKRIAVNYFWFVILSGIVGMVLATVIRLEFAYPGVGVFAGDSIQYLSLASAHGVIMVFFMIMPLLFGAFSNFLLPTQLGVHDVAFPRLNSAAFWFLPGGLLMLCQLVCVDRRYQRMNCFNIREIQSILKRKFFVDLLNTHEHHSLLDKTAIGLRFKTNSINSINSNVFVFYNYGIDFNAKIKSNNYVFNQTVDTNDTLSFSNNSLFLFLIKKFYNINFFSYTNNLFNSFFNNYFTYENPVFFFKNNLKSALSVFFLYTSPEYAITHVSNYFFLLIDDAKNFFIYSLNSFLSFFSNLQITFSQYIISSFLISFENTTQFNSLSNSLLGGLLSFSKFNFYTFYNFIPSFNFSNFTLFLSSFIYDFVIKTYNFFLISMKTNLSFLSLSFSQPFVKLDNSSFYVTSKKTTYVNSFSSLNSYTKTFESFFVKNDANLKLHDAKLSYYKNLSYGNTFENGKLSNSSMFFFYALFDGIRYLFSFLTNLLLNITNFGFLKSSLVELYSFFVNWYLPLLLNENLFRGFKILGDFFNTVFSFFFTIFKENNLNFFYISYFKNTITSQWRFFTTNPLFFFYENFKTLESVIYFFFFNLLNVINDFLYVVSKSIFGFKTYYSFDFVYNLFFLTPNSLFFSNSSSSFFPYYSNYFSTLATPDSYKYTNEELSDGYRYQRFTNPVFKYDYKSGDYFPKLYKDVYSHLFSSILDLTSGLRTSPWFFSANHLEVFNVNFLNYLNNISKTQSFGDFSIHSWNSNKFNHTDGFYNFFYLLSKDLNFDNKKFLSINALNQKFNKLFNTSSMQQRVYSNWRQLKFTREAWRCKLLAARHQKTLFRRYLNEDGVFWSIERNAKDLIPGWAMITPFSSRTRFTAIGKTDIGLMGVLLVLNSSIISAANFLVTYRYLSTLNNRKMRDARAFFTEAVMVASWMMVLANPMLVIGIIMLISDRHWQTSFFDYSGGGDTVLFQHMFWFFGHPEVYIIIIPTFGFTNTMMSYYLRKRVSARASLLYSMYTIAFLGFFVWGHHMYMVGLSHTTRMLFSTLTVMISVPAATKIMHWCVTTVNSSFAMELPLLFTFTFIFFFVSGGISGMCVAHTGMDVLFHDTFYVIGHFHVMLAGGAMFASFGAFYFYFPAIFGVKFSRIYAYLHYVYYLIGQLMTVIPMFWLGYAGMPRRVLDYPSSFGGWHSVISAGHMLNVAGLMAFFIMIFDSLRQARAATRNTFGISRYNTRLNFYIYEIAKLTYVQQKALFLYKYTKPSSVKLNNYNLINYEPYETTLISYVFLKK